MTPFPPVSLTYEEITNRVREGHVIDTDSHSSDGTKRVSGC